MIALLRLVALIGGALLSFSGLFFAGQGSGLIMWPASSFMLAKGVWVLYGALIAALGAGLIWWSRR